MSNLQYLKKLGSWWFFAVLALSCSDNKAGYEPIIPDQHDQASEFQFMENIQESEAENEFEFDEEEIENEESIGTTMLAAGNVDPEFNVACEPGMATIYLYGNGTGIFFMCKSSAFTRSYELHKLKQDAVVSQSPFFAVSGWTGWILNMYFDSALKMERYMRKIEDYDEKANSYQKKGEEYRAKARKASSSKKRRDYLNKADGYFSKADNYRRKADDYREKVEKEARKLDRKAPAGVDIGVNWTSRN